MADYTYKGEITLEEFKELFEEVFKNNKPRQMTVGASILLAMNDEDFKSVVRGQKLFQNITFIGGTELIKKIDERIKKLGV